MPDILSKQFLGILALAFILRAIFIVTYVHKPVSDEADYINLARTLEETGSYLSNGIPTAYRPVGYPAFLSILLLVNESHFFIRTVQALLDLSVVIAIFLLGKRFGEREGLIASFLWAVFPPAILYSGLMLSETAAVFLLVWLFVLLPDPQKMNLPVLAFIGGSLGGMLALVKPWVLVFLLFPVPIFLAKRIDPKSIVLFVGGILFFVFPWMTRNSLAVNSFTLSTNTGANLFIGNNSESTGAYRGLFPAELSGWIGTEDRFSEIAGGIARQYIVDHPGLFVINGFKKTAHVLRGEGELLVWSFHEDMRNPDSSFSEKYRSIPLATTFIVNLPYWTIMLLGIFGLVRFWGDDFTLLFVLFAGTLFAVHAVFFGGSRFHFLLMPFLALNAARVLPQLLSHWRQLTVRRRVLTAFSSAILLALWTYEFVYIF